MIRRYNQVPFYFNLKFMLKHFGKYASNVFDKNNFTF